MLTVREIYCDYSSDCYMPTVREISCDCTALLEMCAGFATTGQTVQEPENGQPYSVNITVIRIGGSIDVVNLQWNATLDGD